MKKKRLIVQVSSLLLVMLVMTGCRPSAPPPAPTPTLGIRVVSTMPAGTPFATELVGAVEGHVPLNDWTRRTAWAGEASFTYTSGPVLLSGSAHEVLPLTADDAFRLTIRRPDDSTEIFYYDLSADCTRPLSDVGPFDLTGYFLPGLNTVHVEVIDMCESAWGTPGLWLVEFR
jgi:hypothetical protein